MDKVVSLRAWKDAPKITEIEKVLAHNPNVPAEGWLFSISEVASKWNIPAVMVLWQYESRWLGKVVIEADGFISVDRRAFLREPHGAGRQLGLGVLQSYADALWREGRQPADLRAWLGNNPVLAPVVRGDSYTHSIKHVGREYLRACGCSEGELDGRLEPYSPELMGRVSNHSRAEHDRTHRSHQPRRYRLWVKGSELQKPFPGQTAHHRS